MRDDDREGWFGEWDDWCKESTDQEPEGYERQEGDDNREDIMDFRPKSVVRCLLHRGSFEDAVWDS
ncbi:hypothetical protein TWF506_005943 [Arthrobotrys conoides]|uniref:Uncharacterized protein n=1 Tax=Arthrobotrys conoides TaxID=74498 RepID=A0AAN8NUK4_9PEZI